MWAVLAMLSALAGEPACKQAVPDCVASPATPLPAIVSERSRQSGSADNSVAVNLDELRLQRRAAELSEALATLPGVLARSRNQDAQDAQISVRGFGARTPFGVRGLRIEYDGIPATAADGQSQVGHIDLAGGGSLRLIRGPLAALYGNGGAYLRIDGARGQRRDGDRVQWAVGSQGQQRLGFAIGGGERLHYGVFANRTQSDGERDQSRSERVLASLRSDLELGAAGTLSLSANYLDQPLAQDPQGLTRAEFAADPRAASPGARLFGTGKTSAQSQLGLRYRGETATTRWDLASFVGDRAIEQMLAVPVAAQAQAGNGGGVVDLARSFAGLSASLEQDLDLAGYPTLVSALIRHERLSEDRLGYENFLGDQLGVRGALRRDETNSGFATDSMLRVDVDASSELRLSAGVRRGVASYRSKDRYVVAGNPDDSGRFEQAAWLPAGGFRWRMSPKLELHGALGRSQELPTLAELAYRDDGDGGFNQDLVPATARQWELGARARTDDWRVEASVFAVHGRNEIVVQSSVGGRSSFRNASGTRRRGIELGFAGALAPRWQLRGAINWLDARYTEDYLRCRVAGCTQPELLIAAGERIPGLPPQFGQLDLQWQASRGSALALEAQAFAATPASDRNRDRVAGFGVVNLRWNQRFQASALGQPSLQVRLDNLFDRRYSSAVVVNEGSRRYYEAGAARSLWLELSLGW